MKAISILTVALAALIGSSSLFAAQREGFGKGRIDPPYSGVENSVPLLDTFYFRFGSGSGGVDHHINSILVMPAGDAEIVGSGSCGPATAPGRVTLMYRDKNADDRYFYKVGHDTGRLEAVRRLRICDVGCTGKCERRLPQDGVVGSQLGARFVLVGFELFFTGGRDHHVDEVAVFEENGVLTVMLNDKNDDDVFGYVVDYAWVPSLESGPLRESRGSNRGGARVELPEGRKVIRGFHFDYQHKDHHLREIGVLTSNGDNLEVFYGDKNGDDPFRWRVLWTTVGPQVVAPVGGASGAN